MRSAPIRPMPRALRAWVVLAIALPLVHCRGVLGIEDVRLEDAGADGAIALQDGGGASRSGASDGSSGAPTPVTADAAPSATDGAVATPTADASMEPSDASGSTPDSATADSRADVPTPPPDGGPPPEGGMCMAGPRCGECCVGPNQMMAVAAMMGHAMMANCVCGPGQCASECATSMCGGGSAMPPPACVACVFDSVGRGACAAAMMACRSDGTCSEVAPCLQACTP